MQNAISRNYRARKKRAPGTHTASDIKNLLIRQDYRCTYCDADLHRVKRHIDHIIPLAKGGGNGPDNLQALCKTCNVRKQATDPEEFAARIRCTAS